MASGNFFGGQFFGGGFFGEITPTPTGRGSWDKTRGKKKKPKAIRFSDFESREALAAAVKQAIEPKTKIIEPTPPLGENDDDAILMAAVSKLIH
jgi:hypothetical protein